MGRRASTGSWVEYGPRLILVDKKSRQGPPCANEPKFDGGKAQGASPTGIPPFDRNEALQPRAGPDGPVNDRWLGKGGEWGVGQKKTVAVGALGVGEANAIEEVKLEAICRSGTF